MSARKWGESFLKSGLPLEHLTAVTLRSAGWHIEPNEEYQRIPHPNEPWFELDMFAGSPEFNGDTELGLLIEAKYHDTSRFWMFLPVADEAKFLHDDGVLGCGPIQTLRNPFARTFSQLAPTSTMGAVLSEDGEKQDNAIYKAAQQLINGFIPYGAGERLFDYNFTVRNPQVRPFWATALVPMVVTNARLFRLKPTIQHLDEIRNASAPTDVADELEWTWCSVRPSSGTVNANRRYIDAFASIHQQSLSVSPKVEERLWDFVTRPKWIAVVNVSALAKVAESLQSAFMSLPMRRIGAVLKPTARKRKVRR
jgi:hypothetical protein